MFDKTIELIKEALDKAIEIRSTMMYLREKMEDVVTQVKDHDGRILALEKTRDLHFEQVKSAFWEAQSRLQLPAKARKK